VERVVAGRGLPLSQPLRGEMEERFGFDFSQVRIHTGAEAERSAAEVGAQAYTVGSHVVFGAARYDAAGRAGRRLIAHELTHVVQQSGATVSRSDTGRDHSFLNRSPVSRAGARVQRHRDDLVAYSGGQSGRIDVVSAGRWKYQAQAVSGHPGHGENEPGVGPIPSGRYFMHPRVTRPTVSSLQGGTCGANGISSGYQQITSTDASPCEGAHYCNVPCPTPDNPAQKCFTPRDCWGPQRIKIEGSQAVDTPEGKRKVRSGFYLHGGNPADAVSSGCVKTLDDGVFAPIRTLDGVRGAVPFCVGSACAPEVNRAIAATVQEILADVAERLKGLIP
jgi:hypothetical protein